MIALFWKILKNRPFNPNIDPGWRKLVWFIECKREEDKNFESANEEINITLIAAEPISIKVIRSIFVVDRALKIKHGEPIWVSKKPKVFWWMSIFSFETKKPININIKTGPVIDKIWKNI